MKNSQVILITGASSGMGKHAAQQLISEGHIVYGAARRVERMKDLEAAGGHAIAMDVTQPDQVQAAVDQIISEQGKIDVLVNNAGYGLYGAIEDITMEEARHQFDVNIFGLADITRKVLPHMRSQKSGKIINLSSMGGRIYTPLGAWYHATKHALEGWSDALRLELNPFNIDVVVIQPGAIETEFGNVMLDPMLKRSAGSPYEPMAKSVASAVQASYEKGGASSPKVITDLISKAIQSNRPKTRYAAGKFAKPMMFIRKYFSDRTFDRVVMSQMK